MYLLDMNIKKYLKIGLLAVSVTLAGTLLTLRLTGLSPGHPSAEEYANAGRSARPGLWLKGEVAREAVTNWDWVKQYSDPFGASGTELETRTWYGIPHSVTVLLVPRGDKLYLSGSEQGARLDKEFPYSKAWWANIERDPRIRMKIDGKIYEATVALVQDRDEVAQLLGRSPIGTQVDESGQEQITSVRHYWRVFKRNIPEYGNGSAM